MNPLSQKQAFIKQIGDENGQNQPKDVTIASNLNSHITTGIISKGFFIYELLQNADDQLGLNSDVHFELNERELIFYHHGKPFDESDVKGICSYGNVKGNRKNKDPNKSGYKDIGFKSVFRGAYRVDILSDEWQFNFNQSSPRWVGGGYPWQIAPIWTETGELSQKAKSVAEVSGRTTFIFHLRDPQAALEELNRLKLQPERILFLKNIRAVNISLTNTICKIYNENNALYIGQNKHSVWMRGDHKVAVPKEIQQYINKLSPEECPERLKGKVTINLSLCYSDECLRPAIDLYSTLPTAEGFGFPFLVDAPFLLNTSRERLVDTKWNVFLIENIARYNFSQIQTGFLQKNYSSLRFLALPFLHTTVPSFYTAFKNCMDQLLSSERLLPAEFGTDLIKVAECEIDEKRLYHAFHKAGVITEGSKYLVHGEVDINEIRRRFKVKVISLKDLLKDLPARLIVHSRTCSLEQSKQIISLVFKLYEDGTLDGNVLNALRGISLFTKANSRFSAGSLLFPDCYQPSFSFQSHFPNHGDYFLSESYLEGDVKQWRTFFSKLGVLQECKIFYENENKNIVEILGDPYVNDYLSNCVRLPGKRAFGLKDFIYNLAWFPLRGIDHSESYSRLFWDFFQTNATTLLKRFEKCSFDASNGKKNFEIIAFFPYVFQKFPLIPDLNGNLRTAKDLYAPSMLTDISVIPNKTARLTVTLSKQMEEWIGFRNNLTVADCHSFISQKEAGFDYESYSLFMRHLLNNLRNNKQEVLQYPWEFYTTNQEWKAPNLLKYWADSSSPPQDEQQWIEPILEPDEMKEFCNYFNMQKTADYGSFDLNLATPSKGLESYLKDRVIYISYVWKRLKTSRQVKDCYERIVDKIKALSFLVLPDHLYSDGQIFIKDQRLYHTLSWEEDKRTLAKVLRDYLALNEKEMRELENAIKKNPPRYGKEFEQFKIEFDAYLPSEPAPHVNPLQTPPQSPRGPLKPIPLIPTFEQPSIPSQVVPEQPKTTKATSTGTPSGRTPKSPPKDPTVEEKKEKKRIGQWAEEHVVWNKAQKYKDQTNFQLTVSDNSGIRRVTYVDPNHDAHLIEIDWKNDPKNRPVEEKDDDLWDSKGSFDIGIVKKVNGVVVKSKKIEVKGTKDSSIHFFLGSSEWKELLASPAKKYQIHVVTNAVTDHPSVTKYKDPLEAIKNQEFNYISKTEFAGPKIEVKKT